MARHGDKRAFFWLGAGAADTAAGGLRQAAGEGVLTAADYGAALTCCRACDVPSACRTPLAGDKARANCRNAPLVTELRSD